MDNINLKKKMICILTIISMTIFSFPVHAQNSFTSKREFRGVWIATVFNTDWPHTKNNAAKQKAEFIHLLEEAKKMRMNAVVVQIRPNSDAFYTSNINPWSIYLTGAQGRNPGYDPLKFMIEESHKRNLEFHAWFNPFRISDTNPDLKVLVPNHPARKNNNWTMKMDKKLYYNPGMPEVRNYVIESIVEVVKNYDIDAVHLDDYFYPYGVTTIPDYNTYLKYRKDSSVTIADWRRNNINSFVRDLSQAIRKTKSYVKFGISPFGIWKNQSSDPTGSKTAGLESYYAIYADSRTWIRNEWIDYVAPQIYWYIGFKIAEYKTLVNWWANEVKGRKVQLYIGQAVYKIGDTKSTSWSNSNEMPNQIAYNRTVQNVKGSIYFGIGNLLKNPLQFTSRLKSSIYRYPTLVPNMTWKDYTPPKSPYSGFVKKNGSYNIIQWKNSGGEDVSYYVVYRFAGNEKINTQSAAKIAAQIKNSGQQQVLYKNWVGNSKIDYTYVVTAVDRLHNESAGMTVRFVTPVLSKKQVKVVKQTSSAITIQVTSVKKGDKVRVYSNTGRLLVVSQPSKGTSLSLSVKKPNQKKRYVYITNQSSGKKESARISLWY